jgi:hypothetical protein
MDWTQFYILIITLGALFIALLSSTIGLFIWNRSESRSDMRMFAALHNDILIEMKDFHGRLERQDADFKAHLMYEHKKI